MEAESTPMAENSILRTLIPNSPPFPAKFEATTVSKLQFQSFSSLNNNQMADDDHQHQQNEQQRLVSDVILIDLNDYHTSTSSCSSKIKSKSKSKTNSAGKVVIELLDDDDNGGDDENDDCVFVKKEKNLTPLGHHKNYPICIDEKLEKEGKFEGNSSKGTSFSINVDDYDDVNDELMIVNVVANSKSSSSTGKRRKPFNGESIIEIGESSRSKMEDIDEVVAEVDPSEMMFVCEICADSRPRKESFRIKGCCHSYCSGCIENYVASKLQDGVSRIDCPVPSCSGVLEPEYCREILPFEVFVRWGNILCESVILASQKFYCPFKDCSALLVDDGSEKVTMSECPTCHRLFCAQCKVGWHHGIDCTEYQTLSKDEREKEDIMLRKLAKSKNWQRCPKCKFYVEKSHGCLYMKCRCGVAFCYSCGQIHTDHTYHYCKKCGR